VWFDEVLIPGSPFLISLKSGAVKPRFATASDKGRGFVVLFPAVGLSDLTLLLI
jgi:hypothetical protein